MFATLSLWKDRAIFTAPTHTSEVSCRPAITLLIGARKPIRVTTADEAYSGTALLVGPNVHRTLAAEQAGLYSLNLDPANRICRYLRNEVFAGREITDLSKKLDPHMRALAVSAVETPKTCAESYRISQLLLDALFPESVGIQPIDPRIDLVASWLWTHLPVRVDLNQLSALCGLSRSRLAHLFTEQVGISIRSYLLWVKMRKAAELFVQDLPRMEVAHAIGFSDSAHLSRSFRSHFALTPSFLSNKALVQVLLCEVA